MPVKLYQGDCLDVLKTLPDYSVDSVVTDPPYGISFMGKKWDYDVPSIEIWEQVLRVLKPGGYLLSFSSTRTYHRMVVAIEDAGFEIRDQLCWLNSQGMPHGKDISKGIDKAAGAMPETATKTEPATDAAKQWEGWNTTLKPSMEPILLARKPLDGTVVDNILKHGVGGLNIDGCRIQIDLEVDDPRLGGQGSWSTESMAKNAYGEFAGERVGSSPIGRYPSGVIWDGSDEVKEVFDSFGDKASGTPGKRRKNHETKSMSGTLGTLDRNEVGYADKGGVHRFFKDCKFSDEERRIFYCGKAVSAKDRQGSKHPTIKPLELMKYLCRLITPKGGMVLDPFAGSGTTGEAAAFEGFDATLIEREEEYCGDIRRRLNLWLED